MGHDQEGYRTEQHEPSSHEPNRLIANRYRLRAPLGAGTTGTVWSAYDEVLYRSVAVKEVLLPAGTPETEVHELHERTMREARAIAALSHPNVITVYDVAQQPGGAPFVVMELISGASLASLLHGNRSLDGTQAAVVADGVAAALDAAHRAGITHRDVKPGNVLVGTDGQVKLTDFGIARNVSDATMTRTGIILGSPAFIAPEIASGEAVTPAADLWSLGAMVFACVQGRPPYDVDDDVLATLNEVVNGDVPPAPDAGPLGPVIAGLMRKEPGSRITPTEVRRIVYWLLPEPGTPAFDPTDLRDREEHTSGRAPPAAPPSADAAGRGGAPGEQAAARTPDPVAAGAPLSPDPGPLPFTPTPAAPRRRTRGRAAGIVLGAVAVVLFTAAAAGGFALSRTVADKPLEPPHATTTAPTAGPATTTPAVTLRQVTDEASPAGAQGGGYRIKVPNGWTSFTEQRSSVVLPPSTVVHYVSADGQRELTVSHLPRCYPNHSIQQYLGILRRDWPEGDFTLTRDHIVDGLDASNARESAHEVLYRTVEAARDPEAGNAGLGRTTYADLFPYGTDLWAVSVVVPTDQEDSGASQLFSRIAPSFHPREG